MTKEAEPYAQTAAEQGRHIQSAVDLMDVKSERETSKKAKKPMEAGAREYPSEFPAQHLQKSGSETDLQLAPMYDAPGYQGSHKLQDKVGLITGGDSGIGRAVAVLFAREGCDVAVCYMESRDDALVTKNAVEKEGRRCLLIEGDVFKF